MNQKLLHKVYSLLILSDTKILFLIDLLFLANLVMAAESNRNNRIAALFGGAGKRRLINKLHNQGGDASRERCLQSAYYIFYNIT